MIGEDVSYTLATAQDQTMFQPQDESYTVRRIMPVEAERLQDFPDGFTDITGCDVESVTDAVSGALKYEYESDERKLLARKVKKWSEECPDSPRYKALGNSITTTVLEIIGRRIEAFDELHYDEIGLEG